MEYGMSIEVFMDYTNAIKEECEELLSLKEGKNVSEVYPEEIRQKEDRLWFTTTNFVDISHGFILTDDENMTKDFEIMFNFIQSFLQNRNQIEHCRAEINRALKERDDDKLIKSAEYLKLFRALFSRNIDDLLKHATYIKDEYFRYSK